MRIPYTWLKEYLPELPPAEELAEALTMGGLEVEEIRDWAPEGGGAREQVLVTKITANRGDLLSVLGTARHAAAILGLDFAPPRFACPETEAPVRDTHRAVSGEVTVEIVDPVGCPRYSGLLIKGVKIAPSPDWLRHRLEASGVRSISNVVDVTNYVCWELGQPMHAFDFRFIQNGHILVRRAQPDELVMLIDESVPVLSEEDVVIADPLGPVALAGVMGGADSQVRESTTTVLLEAAHFDPTAIRKTSLRLGMSTEASYRFERHVDPNLTLPALARAAQLITELAGGEIVGPAADVCAREFAPRVIRLRPARCNALLGTDLTAEQMAAYLRRVGCEVEEGEVLTARVPTARWDVEREVDLIEEVAIVHGYNNIPETIPGRLRRSGRLTREQRLERRAGEILRHCGLSETWSFSMMSPADIERLRCSQEAGERRWLALLNPQAAEAGVMRTTLLPALLAACAYNQRQRVRDIALYEIGRVFLARGPNELPEERRRVAGVLAGSPYTSTWNLPPGSLGLDFFWVKGLVEQFLAEMGVEKVSVARAEHPSFAEGACAAVLVGERLLGHLGEIAPPVAEAFDVRGPVLAFELDFDAILAAASLVRQYRPLPRFPAALRDVAVLVPDSDEFSAGRLAAEIRAAAGECVESVEPFDLFVPPGAGEGRKSVAFELVFRAPDRTLTDEEINAAMTAVHQRLEALGGEVRKQ